MLLKNLTLAIGFALPFFPSIAFSQSASAVDSASVQQPDRWQAPDKYSHMTISAFLTAGQFFVLHEQMRVSERRALSIAVTTTAAIGIAKEIYDGVSGKGTPSFKDLIADCVGIALAAAFVKYE